MYIGIDVGGTFTDGVIISKGQVLEAVKVPTYPQLTRSITEVLTKILNGKEAQQIKRIVLSTTIVTNLLAQGKQVPVGLILLPGPGVNPATLRFAGPITIVDGAIDYRGRLLEDLNKEQLLQAAQSYLQQGISKIVVACKFSQRNNVLEENALQILMQQLPQCEFLASYQVSGLLNWVRRANGAVYTLATRTAYHSFVQEVTQTLAELGISCPVQILKADGGTLPLEVSLAYPLEALYSGPAASVMGALATNENDLTAVIMDIGGTTTDLALILQGVPLLAERGASLQDHPIPVRALAVSSIPLGGDNALELAGGELILGERKGPAMCLGGPCLTVTDLMAEQGYAELPLTESSKAALADLAASLGKTPGELANLVMDKFIGFLEVKLEEMLTSWEEEPAYRIWQVLHQQTARPSLLICQGGPAKGLGPIWARHKGWQVRISPYAHVANAVGAALARNTLKLEYTADTQQRIFATNIGGYQGQLPERINNLAEAHSAAQSLFSKIAKEWSLELEQEPELLYEESFNMVRGWSTTGRIMQVGLQTPPGLCTKLAKEVV